VKQPRDGGLLAVLATRRKRAWAARAERISRPEGLLHALANRENQLSGGPERISSLKVG
jgi:hypothetical protein